MKLQDICAPVRKEIDEVERELRSLAVGFPWDGIKEIIERFFLKPGKYLRPALLLLSAKSVQERPTAEARRSLVLAATGVELIHNASLVHDDILDDEQQRRGQPTVNKAWGTRIALLTGDTIYSRAFGFLVEALPADLLRKVVALNVTMCSAEVEQERSKGKPMTRERFLRINEGKTASFMQLCCALGATVAGGSAAEIEALDSFGLEYGMAYQLFDDHVDKDVLCPEVDTLAEGKAFAARAVSSLSALKPSAGKDGLLGLVDYLREAGAG